jgi:hypothetical protein
MLRVLSPSVLWGVALGIGALLGALVVSLADDHRIVPAAWTAVLPLAGALTIAMAIHLAMKTASVSSLSTAPEN